MAKLTKEQLLAPRRRQRVVPLPLLDGDAVVQSPSDADEARCRDAARLADGTIDPHKYDLALLQACLVEPAIEEADLVLLAEQDARTVEALKLAIIELRVSDDAEAEDSAMKAFPDGSDG